MSNPYPGFEPRLRAAIKQHFGVHCPGAAAADATEDFGLFAAAYDCILERVSWIPKAAVTGAATNHFTLEVENRLADDSGTAVLGTATTYASGTNAAENVEEVLVDTGDNERISAGDVIVLQRTLVGTGLAMPEGVVSVVLSVLDNA